MQYTINQLYQHIYEKVDNIYDIFKGFFGENNVDLQYTIARNTVISYIIAELQRKNVDLDLKDQEYNTSYDVPDSALESLEAFFALNKSIIYVWWNRVKITNENNKSVTIQDLYAKIEVQMNGRIPYENHGFLLNRATYSKEQFLSDYMHSHICEIPKDDFTKFEKPCLGTGPINGTIMTLKNDYDEVTWMLFCDELSLYVTVESLTGRPYKYLEHIGYRERLYRYNGFDFTNNAYAEKFYICFSKEDFIKFIKYYLQKGHLSITYKNGKYSCGMPYYEYIIDISNAFIDYYNAYLIGKENSDRLFNCGILNCVLFVNGKFYRNENTTCRNLDRYRNNFVLNFKGKDIYTTITEDAESESTLTTVIDNDIAMYILKSILRIINFRYNKNEHKFTTAGINQGTSTVKERISYL